MMPSKLTECGLAAKTPVMQDSSFRPYRSGWRAVRAATMVVAGAMACSGCVSVNAPDKPIVIELNINIKQEVIYRLAADAGSTIDANPGIF